MKLFVLIGLLFGGVNADETATETTAPTAAELGLCLDGETCVAEMDADGVATGLMICTMGEEEVLILEALACETEAVEATETE